MGAADAPLEPAQGLEPTAASLREALAIKSTELQKETEKEAALVDAHAELRSEIASLKQEKAAMAAEILELRTKLGEEQASKQALSEEKGHWKKMLNSLSKETGIVTKVATEAKSGFERAVGERKAVEDELQQTDAEYQDQVEGLQVELHTSEEAHLKDAEEIQKLKRKFMAELDLKEGIKHFFDAKKEAMDARGDFQNREARLLHDLDETVHPLKSLLPQEPVLEMHAKSYDASVHQQCASLSNRLSELSAGMQRLHVDQHGAQAQLQRREEELLSQLSLAFRNWQSERGQGA